MTSAKQALQDLIDNLDKQIVETEGIIQAQQGCLVTLKKQKVYIIAKKKSIEDEEKREAEALKAAECDKKRKSRPRKKGGQTPLKD
jgi:hypothetical protein